jgi:hypothetical protein
MMQRLYGQLPDFARPFHPVMRYILSTVSRQGTLRWRVLRGVGLGVFAILMLYFGWQVANGFGVNPIDTPNPLDRIFLVLYWPLTIMQLLMRMTALSSTVSIILSESQRGTWDTLKITTDGAPLLMKTRWAAVFYRLWFFLTILMLARVFFIVVALIDLSSFQGRYLDLLLSGTTPFGPPHVSTDTSVILGIITVAMMMTASLLGPFTAIAFDAGARARDWNARSGASAHLAHSIHTLGTLDRYGGAILEPNSQPVCPAGFCPCR